MTGNPLALQRLNREHWAAKQRIELYGKLKYSNIQTVERQTQTIRRTSPLTMSFAAGNAQSTI